VSDPSFVLLADQFSSNRPTNAMSVDVEDYFHVAAFKNLIGRSDWSKFEYRAVANVERILQLFDDHSVKATFFVLGWVAEKSPDLIRLIAENQHELASHGMYHEQVFELSPDYFRDDVTRSKKILEDLSGAPVRGYRAPSYSINHNNLWALDVLDEAGYEYSSSIYPIAHDLYGMPSAPRFAFKFHGRDIVELPITSFHRFGRNWPCGGGGYFRLLPYRISRRALRSINGSDRQPAIFYFHPWEIDPKQPVVEGAGLRSRFRHYTNLKHFYPKLSRLLQDFRWGRMDDVFGFSA
jgi:polysaccharide deacetylase family protein (PEP-CTERM system associated)